MSLSRLCCPSSGHQSNMTPQGGGQRGSCCCCWPREAAVTLPLSGAFPPEAWSATAGPKVTFMRRHFAAFMTETEPDAGENAVNA